ncbi:putative F-box domain-containing protein [Rosa chinensis]|uniref:Putative F-box domain-containing protein n=1 Tax=Rosa chinensis TaxID=74649 RepID=A0A2P6R790_ROSCH|nr:F-box/kelch-repeat protein At3g06240 [Rosa chinensis]PRQ42269.1 putative F-box domain-containing protein [Rosa chinensis]
MSEEIMVSILSILPPKSVMRFKCVRKSWYSLINNSSFIAKHLSNTMCNKHSTSILCKSCVLRDINTDEKEVVCSLISLSSNSNNDEHHIHSAVEDIHIPLSFGVTTRGQFKGDEVLLAVSIIGHCDGIICLVASLNIVLWNPAIKEFKILPNQCLPNGTLNSMAFGYDPKSKDYKFLNIVDPSEETLGEHRIVYDFPRIEVYTLSTDSWREMKTYSLETETTMFLCFTKLYFNGFCYWIGCEKQKDFMDYFDRDDEEWVRQVIHSFDMSTEVFDHILLPNSLYLYEPLALYFNMHVILWNESIALFGLYHWRS